MVYVECYADKALVNSLGIGEKKIVHAGGKSNVCKRLKRDTDSIGLVDEDPRSAQPSYIKSTQLHQECTSLNIKLWLDRKRRNRIIMLCPRLEEWIIKAVKDAGQKMGDFGVSNNPYVLHSELGIKPEKLRGIINGIQGQSERIRLLKKFLVEV